MAPAAIPKPIVTNRVPSTPPAILLTSNESMPRGLLAVGSRDAPPWGGAGFITHFDRSLATRISASPRSFLALGTSCRSAAESLVLVEVRRMNPIVLIPARMGSTRLAGKPLADIAGVPMIVHVWRRAVEADLGPVLVATDDDRIVAAVAAAGGRAVMTRADHPSGTDRIHEAVEAIDPDGRHDVVVNVQGDLPTVEPRAVRAALAPLDEPRSGDLDPRGRDQRGTRKRPTPTSSRWWAARSRRVACGRCISRAPRRPGGEGPLFHHIGLYVYRRAALRRFVGLPPSPLERREKLEQLRALEAGMRIDAAVVETVPLGVDTRRNSNGRGPC